MERALSAEDGFSLSEQIMCDGGPMPPWAAWLVTVGQWARDLAPQDVVVALSVPSRTHAAAFVMTGVHDVGAREVSPVSVDQAMTLIEAWGIGAKVGFDFVRSRREGTITHVADDCVEIKTDANTTCKVPRNNVLGIELLPDGVEPRRRPRPFKEGASLRSALYPRDPIGHIGSSRIECLVIGQKVALKEDLSVRISSVGSRLSGTLEDLTRPRSLLSPGSAFRTDVMSYTSEELPSQAETTPPKVVVIDGSGAILEWLGRAPKVATVAIVDRAEARAEDAAGMLLARRAAAGTRKLAGDFPFAPAEVEVIAYYRGAP